MSEHPIGQTKLKNVGSVLGRFSPMNVVHWYHRKYVASNRINPFFHVFIGLSAFGWFMHERRHGHVTQHKHH